MDTKLPAGVRMHRLPRFEDERGSLAEIFSLRRLPAVAPVQWNLVRSRPGGPSRHARAQGGSGTGSLRCSGLGSALSVRALEPSGAEMCVELKNGRRFGAELDRRRHVSRWMVTLPVRQPVRRTLLITRDMLDGEEFRRLRLWTLWGRLPRRESVAAAQLRA